MVVGTVREKPMDNLEINARCPQCETSNLVVIAATAPNKIQCCRCGSVLLDYTPIRGYVYVLSNDQMPGLVKVGFTSRDVAQRVAELNSGTAVPSPFVIEAVFACGDPERDEQEVHRQLAATRLQGREFFRCDLRDALRAVAQICGQSPKYLRDPSLLVDPKQSSSTPPPSETELLRQWQERMYRK
jgi:hypothetical protein